VNAKGTVRQERSGNYTLRLRAAGRERRIPLGHFKSAKQARSAADARLVALNLAGPSAGELITLNRWAPIFLGEVCAQKKPATVAGYRSIMRCRLLPLLGGKTVAEIASRDFTKLVAELEKDGKAPRTVRLTVTVLAHAIRAAVDNGYAGRVPDLKHLRLGAKRSAVAEMRCFTPEETSRILKAAPYPWRALYALLAYTGMRCGEALGLEWRHIDFAAKQITIGQGAYMGVVQSTKSAGSATTLPMPDVLARELAEWTYQRPEGDSGGLLFASPRDPKKPIWSSGVRRSHFAPLLKKLGIPPAGLHAFRHGFATQLFALGTPATVVKELLRHADMKTTLRYAHVTREDQRTAAEAFSLRIGGVAHEAV
jgi:integrase